MRLVVLGIALAWLSAAFSAANAAEPKPAPVMLTVPQGALAGTTEDGIATFKGIPFAAPPVGPLRWRAPQAAPGWQGVRAADAFGFTCPQQKLPLIQRLLAPHLPESEDCLTLN